jgi:hypothetical protein
LIILLFFVAKYVISLPSTIPPQNWKIK